MNYLLFLMGFLNEDNNNKFSSRFSSYIIYLNMKYNRNTFKQLVIFDQHI